VKAALPVLVFWISSTAIAQEKPPLPYYDWGACPFECCTYRTWEAVRPVIARKSRSRRSAAVFHIKRGEQVQGITGVVITSQYGVTEILKPLQIGYTKTSKSPELSLRAGDIIYTLHYLGEAYDLFWYHGKTYSDEISVPENAWGKVPYSDALRVKSRPKTDWWVKMKNHKGEVGWSNEVDAFAHMDACE
jgi:hypothetical protein